MMKRARKIVWFPLKCLLIFGEVCLISGPIVAWYQFLGCHGSLPSWQEFYFFIAGAYTWLMICLGSIRLAEEW